ncbi:MAG: helix-turn-helix transcriptional regulator [Oscillospiraceae bacterium]|nr:helix-turn-helix transcriptional regulator [Oscillospiraceae bacterium]
MEDLTIGQRIAAKRRELGISQIELGERMGVSRQSVSKWEADGAIPEIDKLIALSKLFGVRVGWLLGVEHDAPEEEAGEAEFTDREWELIDRLTQECPQLPKWLMPLTAAAAAVSFCAAILAGAALWSAHSRKADLALISQAVANLTTDTGQFILDQSMLESHQFLAEPSDDLSECTFTFYGSPADYSPDDKAELVIFRGVEEIQRLECDWNGTYYTASFTVSTDTGYTPYFYLTTRSGIVRTSRVFDALLQNLHGRQDFGTVGVEIGSHDYDGSGIELRDLRFIIEAPDIFRDQSDLWSRCELVVVADGAKLGSIDILNRSKYSKQVNFSENYVNFYTKSQTIPTGDLSGYSHVELILDCGFWKDLDLTKTVASWIVRGGKLAPYNP